MPKTRIFTKPINFIQENHYLSMIPIKPKFGYKKDYITMINSGYILFEFIPLITNEELKKILNWQSKKSFVLDNKRANKILFANPKEEFEFKMNYQVKDKNFQFTEEKILLFKTLDNLVKIEFIINQNGSKNIFKSQIERSDFLVIQKLIEVI